MTYNYTSAESLILYCYNSYMTKRLYRSREHKVIAGVCGGIAEYFNIDPVIIRVIAVLLLLPGGLPGFVPYVVLWIIIPKHPGQAEIIAEHK